MREADKFHPGTVRLNSGRLRGAVSETSNLCAVRDGRF